MYLLLFIQVYMLLALTYTPSPRRPPQLTPRLRPSSPIDGVVAGEAQGPIPCKSETKKGREETWILSSTPGGGRGHNMGRLY